MPKVKLLATDLDGTLIGHADEFSLYDEFGDRLRVLRAKYGTIWVACTGRSLHSFLHFVAPLSEMGLAPKYVIIKHAYIYRLTRFGYRPHYVWNFLIRYQIWSSLLHIKEALRKWQRMITGMSSGVSTIFQTRNRLCLRFDTEESAEAAALLLKKESKRFKHLRVFQFYQEVDVRTVPFTKGLALGELVDRLGIDSAHVLAIGNGHNDISMLDGSVAKLMGCPSNAETDVMGVVHKNGGHIASKKMMGGVIETLDAYRDNHITSDLPEWWVPTREQENPRSAHRSMGLPNRKKKRGRKAAAGWLGVLIGYAVLMVFASFGLIPLSELILKPFMLLMSLIEKIMLLFS
jgi:HAD superfamily hydrolase (TIGR01484 family)